MCVAKISTDIWLSLASDYAKRMSGCLKVQVGSVIVKDNKLLAFGANRTIPNLCKTSRGCLRVEKFGENDKTHRNPEDCRAIHSEIDAICNSQVDLSGATIYVTRYPCEACAKAIIASGISRVIYGRETKVSEQTCWMLEDAGVEVIHFYGFTEADNTN